MIEHAEFGRCVLLPKTEWSRVPSSGPAVILVDGTARDVTVAVELCDCQGAGEHEHRFLTLPDAVPEGSRVTLGLPAR